MILQETQARIRSLAGFCRSRTGWQRHGLAFLAGGSTALAFAPFFLFPVLFVAFPLFIWLLEGTRSAARPLRSAALVGWSFGFGSWLVGIHWIVFPFLVDIAAHGWMAPFALILMPGGLALFTLLAGLATRLMFDHLSGTLRIVGFAIIFMLMEWLRGTILTGFPWNLYAYVWNPDWGLTGAVAQSGAVIGAWGLSFLTVFLAASPAALAMEGERDARMAPAPLLAATAIVVLFGMWGFWRVPEGPGSVREGVLVRIVQPAISQQDKWKPENRMRVFADYQAMSAMRVTPEGPWPATVPETPNLIVWPESALPFLLDRSPGALAQIDTFLGSRSMLFTGAARIEELPDGSLQYFNAVFGIGDGGEITRTYDKYHLVPFGEYVPFRPILGLIGLQPLVEGTADFTSGPGPRVLASGEAGAVAPMICYEAIFPGRLTGKTERRPDWILNVTNDAWFGHTSGPPQHLAIARFRAIEEGIPMVRAANTGISAVIDPWGRTTGRIPLGQRAVLDRPLPVALTPTPFARFGQIPFWLAMTGLAILVGMGIRQEQALPAEGES